MKKKILAVFLVVMTMIMSVAITGQAEENVRVMVNGQYVEFPDQQPIIVNGRTLVPIRAVLEKLGAIVEWDEQYQIVRIYKGNKAVGLQVNAEYMTVGEIGMNGQTTAAWNKEIDVAPQLIQGRTMLPIRCVVEEFGCNVEWEESTQTVIINTANYVPVEIKAIVIGE